MNNYMYRTCSLSLMIVSRFVHIDIILDASRIMCLLPASNSTCLKHSNFASQFSATNFLSCFASSQNDIAKCNAIPVKSFPEVVSLQGGCGLHVMGVAFM